MKKSQVRFVLLLAFLTVFLVGCNFAKIRNERNNAPQGRVVAISLFKCNCELTVKEAVQDTIVDVFFKYTNAKLVKSENGDIVITGTITMDVAQTEQTSSSVRGGLGSVRGNLESSSLSGSYVTGITILAYKNGELIATHSEGQNLGNGQPPLSPISLAQNAANYIYWDLISKNEMGRKE